MTDDGTSGKGRQEPPSPMEESPAADSHTTTHGGETPDIVRRIRTGTLPDRRTRADRRSVERRRRHAWNLFFFFAVVVAVLFVLPTYLMDDGPGASLDVPPDELLGTWTTGAQRYAGRFIRIEDDRLTLGLGDGVQESYPVQSIRVEAEEVQRHYRIRYSGADGTDEELEVFVYDDGLMRLKNPSEVRWTRSAN